ncbi:MAG: hypothetical protein R3322_00020 [Kiloniellales bacterium]|nr:hypothetical protein [Kiloniellales bacterium]
MSTLIETSGDLYTADSSLRAIALGPNSDVAQVQLTYIDANNRLRSGSIILDARKALVGRLDALLTQQYSSGQRGQLFITLLDWMPPAGFQPNDFLANDFLSMITPRLDLLGYLKEQPTYISARADAVWEFDTVQNAPGAPAPQTWYGVPAYGRRTLDVGFKLIDNDLAMPDADITVFGINFTSTYEADFTDTGYQQEQLAQQLTIVPGDGVDFHLEAEAGGWDYYLFRVNGSAGAAFPLAQPNAISLKITTRD